MSEMVERVARALVPVLSGGQEDVCGRPLPSAQFDDLNADWQARYLEYALVAIMAMRDPTEAMVEASETCMDDGTWTDGEYYWAKMIDEASK